MQGAKVFFAQSDPALFAFSRPKIARQTKALAMVIDLDQLLIAPFSFAAWKGEAPVAREWLFRASPAPRKEA
jgi:hypothetical protein